MQFELTKEYLEVLKEAINNADEKRILEKVADLHAADIAEILDELSLEEAKYLYKLFDEKKAADVLIELEEDVRRKFLASLTSREIAEQFIDNLESDDAADIISELPEALKEEVITHIEDVDQASDIVDLLHYEEGTSGALMAKELISVNINWTVLKCTKEMRKQAEQIDYVYTVYVIDDKGILAGTLSLKKMLISPAKTKVTDIYNADVISVKTSTTNEDTAQIMEKYDLVVLPVVDELGRLVGRITIDDVVDVMKEEAEKDYQMASGLSENVESGDSILTLTRARLPWLLIGMLGGILGAEVIGIFDLKENLEMVFFIPLIAAMGGNVGVQSSAIIVQALANKSLGIESHFSRLLKELGVALLNGIICSLLILGAGLVLGYTLLLSITVSIALLAVIIFAAIFGTFVPLTLNKYKIDPALATGPFITTFNDVFGLLLYFAIGKMIYF